MDESHFKSNVSAVHFNEIKVGSPEGVMARLAFLERTHRLPISELNFDDFCRDLLIAVSEAIPCAAGSILEYDSESETLFFRACLGQNSAQFRDIKVPASRGIVGHVLETRQSFLAEELEQNTFHLKSVERVVGYEGRNLIAAPILIRGRVYGVIELLDRLVQPSFDRADLELLENLTVYLASFLETRMVLSYALSSGPAQSKQEAA